jgi:hypothetical protein
MGVSRRFVAKPTWQRRTTYNFFRLHDPAFVFLARLFRTRHLRGKQYVCVSVSVCSCEKVDSAFDPSWLPTPNEREIEVRGGDIASAGCLHTTTRTSSESTVGCGHLQFPFILIPRSHAASGPRGFVASGSLSTCPTPADGPTPIRRQIGKVIWHPRRVLIG